MKMPSNMTGSHDADMNDDGLAETLFQVRVWRRSPLQDSIEWTCLRQAAHSLSVMNRRRSKSEMEVSHVARDS